MARQRKVFFKDYYTTSSKETLPSRQREQLCEALGCLKKGLYRAPKSRDHMDEYRWFCLGHIQEYNAQWDYLKGLTPQEIEEEIRADVFWRRPSGHRLTQFRLGDKEKRIDPFGFFEGWEEGKSQQKLPRRPSLPDDIAEALQILGVSFPITLIELKRIYKKKVKQYHPDLHGGSKETEAMLKDINRSFQLIQTFLSHDISVT